MVKKITEKEFKDAVKSGVSIVDFSAVWCGPCKMMEPVLEELSEDYEGRVSFFNVDVDENPTLSREYAIMNIPALALIKDGEKVEMFVGFRPKENIAEFIEKNL